MSEAIALIPLGIAIRWVERTGKCRHNLRRNDRRWIACMDCGISLGPMAAPLPLSKCSISKLKPLVLERLLSEIRNGVYDHVAAMAAGISSSAFKKWMADPRPEFEAFQHLINTARAEARLVAEKRVYEDDPKFWLTKGPGKDRAERPYEPGWSDVKQVAVTGAVDHNHSGTIKHDTSKLATHELDEMERLLLKAQVIDVQVEPVDGGSDDV